MYIDPDTKLEDNRSTAVSFTIVGGVGLILLVLVDLGIIPLPLADFQKILMSVVMGILFVIFFIVGLHSFLAMKKLKSAAQSELSLDKEITDWFLQEYTGFMQEYTSEDMDSDEPEALYYPRYDKICALISEKYPSLSDEFKDHLAENLYTTIFPE